MKRHYLWGGALLLVLSSLGAACTSDLFEGEADTYQNPYLSDSRSLVTSLIDSAVNYTSSDGLRGPIPNTHGELLLEALGSAPGVDIDVPRLYGLLSTPRAAGKAPVDDPFPGETRLSPEQKGYLDIVLDRAALAADLGDLTRILSEVDSKVVNDLGPDDARPILAITAGLFAQYEYFTSPNHAGTIRRLVWQIRDYPVAKQVRYQSGASRSRLLRIQDSGDGRGGDPPPFWGQFFNPGEWWAQTIEDTRVAAELGVLAGAGVGCLVGAVPTGGLGCGPGGAVGGMMGGLFGILVGGITAGIANFEESQHGFEVAEAEWCQQQARLSSVLRDKNFRDRCDVNHN